MRRAVFLDRDGVINRAIIHDGKPHAPLTLADVDIAPGVPDALERLRRAGFLLIVVTNQPDVIRRQASRREIDAIHARMLQTLPLDDIRVCYHDDPAGCACRKPSPGMLYAAAIEREIQLAGSYLVGDRWRDILAGRRAGCTTLLVDGGYDEPFQVDPDVTVKSLAEAADWIIRHSDEDRRPAAPDDHAAASRTSTQTANISYQREHFGAALVPVVLTRMIKARRIIHSLPPGRLLDVGCGTGEFAALLRNDGWHVTGIDLFDAMPGNVDTSVVANVEDPEGLPVPDASMDGVFLGEVIEHVLDTDHLLRQCFRVLRPGGSLVLTTPNLASLPNRIRLLLNRYPNTLDYRIGGLGHVRLYTTPTLERHLRDVGFDWVKITGSSLVVLPMSLCDSQEQRGLLGRVCGAAADLLPSLAHGLIVHARKPQ